MQYCIDCLSIPVQYTVKIIVFIQYTYSLLQQLHHCMHTNSKSFLICIIFLYLYKLQTGRFLIYWLVFQYYVPQKEDLMN